MATMKTDFAQKLLHDLRLRKERMAAAESQQQYSSNGSSSSSTRGSSPGPAYKGYQQTNTYEHVGLKSGNSFSKPNGRSKSYQFEDTSNHEIVPYMNDERSSAVMELGFHKKTEPKGRNPMLNFLQEIGKRSLGKGRIEIRSSFGKNSSADSHVITFSQVHVGEISKGIQKLNQILKNCSKGISLERYSSDVGKELLKGAIDLEQSLRMLANVNEGSSRGGGKNKIKLLEDTNKDNDNKNARSNDLNQVERPRFSFDKPNKNASKTKNIVKQQPEENMSKPVIHSRSFSMDLDAENEWISSGLQRKNPRTSNVIAKLMGLEDLPRKDDSIKSRESQPQHTKKSIPPFSKSKPTNVDSVFALKAAKIMSPNRGSSTGLVAENDTSARSVTRFSAVMVDNSIQIDEDHGNKIIQQETGKEDNDDDEEKEKNIVLHDKALTEVGVYESKHEKHSLFHNLQQQKKAKKLNALEEKRKLQHSKPKPLTREPKGSHQACKTIPRDLDKRQTSKKSPLEANRPKIFNKGQGLDSSTTGETDELKIWKHQTEVALKPETHSILHESIERENAKKTIISGLAKQESGPLTTDAVSNPKTSLQTAKSTDLSSKVAEENNYYNQSEEKDQSPDYSKPPTANANIINIAEEVTNDFLSSPQLSLCADDTEMQPLKASLPQHKGNHEVAAVSIHVAESKNTIKRSSWYTDQLTESENELKGILIKNRLFLHTAEALFKLNIPVIILHDVDHSYKLPDKNNKVILDCGIELLMKKAKRRQLSYYPFKSQDCTSMFQSFDGLIRQLNRNLCTLESYGGEWDEEYDPSENIYQMLEKDVEYRDPDINSMWDFGWNENTIASSEKDEVIKEVEKHILRKILDELTRDLLHTPTNAISSTLPHAKKVKF